MNDWDEDSPACNIAELIVDLLVDAGVIKQISRDRAIKIVIKELEAQAEIGTIIMKKS